MADSTVSALPTGTPVGTDYISIVQGGVNKKALISTLPFPATMTSTVGGIVPTPPNNTTTFLRGDGTFATPSGSGDMILASTQVVSGLKTFLSGMFSLRNMANTFNALFTNTNTADRTYTLKDATGTLAFTTDITGTNSNTNTGDETTTRINALYGATVPTISSTSTITNKRNTKRVVATTQAATPAINTDGGDIFQITALAQAITSMTTSLTGTPVAGDMMMVQITDNGTAKTIAFGASFAGTTVALPTTTVISTTLRILFQRNNANTIWDCIAVS